MGEAVSTTVRFRGVPGHAGYRVGDDGSVWTCWRFRQRAPKVLSDCWRPVKQTLRSDGRFAVSLAQSGTGRQRVWFLVHRLVLKAFVGPCPPGMEARHLNGIASDNWLGNLAWGSPSANGQDEVRLGRSMRGPKHPKARLTTAKAEEIRRRFAQGETQTALAREFGLSQSRVSRLVHHRTYLPH